LENENMHSNTVFCSTITAVIKTSLVVVLVQEDGEEAHAVIMQSPFPHSGL
jgi:hypothetical protein